MDETTAPQYSGPTTTAESAKDGRLKVDAGKVRKRKAIRKIINAKIK